MHDAKHEQVLEAKRKSLQESALQALATNGQWMENTDALKALGELGTKPTTHYKTEAEAIRHSSEVENIQQKIKDKSAETDPYTEQLAGHVPVELGTQPVTHYDTEAQAVKHSTQVNNLLQQITSKHAETDPYSEQIEDMQQQALQGQAVRAGAFGGSREGIQRAELGRNLMQTQNQAIAQSLQQGYGQALGTAQQQQQAQLAAAGQLGNQAQGIGSLAGQQYGIGQNMAQSLSGMGAQLGNLGVQQGALGQSAQQLGQQDVNFLYNIGQQQQALTQQQNDAQRNAALQQAYEPYQRLAFLSDIYKGAPSSQQSISAATAPTPSVFQQAVGTGIAGLAAGTAAKKAGLF
jgi:type I site-specific restriction endonuclease